jgi:hypothetical protein
MTSVRLETSIDTMMATRCLKKESLKEELFFLGRKSLIVEPPEGVLFSTNRIDELITKPRNILSILTTLPINLQIKTDIISYSIVKLTLQVTNILPAGEPRFQSICECTVGGSDVCHPLGFRLASGRTSSAMNVLLGSGMASVTFACEVFCRRGIDAEMRLRNSCCS